MILRTSAASLRPQWQCARSIQNSLILDAVSGRPRSMSSSSFTRREANTIGCATAWPASVRPPSLSQPQFEADVSGQRSEVFAERGRSLMCAKTAFQNQLHEVVQLGVTECFEPAFGSQTIAPLDPVQWLKSARRTAVAALGAFLNSQRHVVCSAISCALRWIKHPARLPCCETAINDLWSGARRRFPTGSAC